MKKGLDTKNFTPMDFIWENRCFLIALFMIIWFGCLPPNHVTDLTYKVADNRNLYAVAERFYYQNRYDKAAKIYQEFIESDPNSEFVDEAFFRLGKIYISNGEYPEGIGAFNRIIREHPGSDLVPSARFEIARSFYLASFWQGALEELMGFQGDFPTSAYTPEAKLMIIECYNRLMDYEQAKELAREFVTLYPDSPFKGKALYQLGLAEMHLKEYDQALEHLRHALFGNLSPEQKLNTFYFLGSLYLDKGDIRLAGMNFSDLFAYAVTDKDKEWVTERVEELIQLRMSDEQLQEIMRVYPYEFPGDIALIELAERAFREGNFTNARYYWERFLSNFSHHSRVSSVKNKLASYKERYDKDEGPKIGCIAPLTGPLAGYGEKLVRGIKLAIEEYNERVGTSVKVVLFDSQAESDKAQKGVELLAKQEKVCAIIGPLLTSTTIAAAEVAERIGIPLFTPTATGEGFTGARKYIFRNCLTNLQQVELLVNFAIDYLGNRRFGIMYPYNAYGQEIMSLFVNKVEVAGAQVDIIEFYDQEDTDFKEQLLRIHKVKPEALFLPGSYEKILLIAPQIPFYKPELDPNDPNQVVLDKEENAIRTEDIYTDAEDEIFVQNRFPKDMTWGEEKDRPMQLLGTDGWYDETLIKEAGPYVDKALISVGFFPESEDYTVRRFYNSFLKLYGEVPDLVSAQSYDATNMVLEASDGGKYSWDVIRTNLHKIKNFSGVSGNTTILPSGDSEKKVTLLQIRKGRFVPIEPEYIYFRNLP